MKKPSSRPARFVLHASDHDFKKKEPILGHRDPSGGNPKVFIGITKPPMSAVLPVALIHSSGQKDGRIKYGPMNWRETEVSVGLLRRLHAPRVGWWDGQDFAEDSSVVNTTCSRHGLLRDHSRCGSQQAPTTTARRRATSLISSNPTTQKAA